MKIAFSYKKFFKFKEGHCNMHRVYYSERLKSTGQGKDARKLTANFLIHDTCMLPLYILGHNFL